MANQLASMYANEINKSYLTFINNTLKAVIDLNELFQSDKADPLKLFQELKICFIQFYKK